MDKKYTALKLFYHHGVIKTRSSRIKKKMQLPYPCILTCHHLQKGYKTFPGQDLRPYLS